MIKSLQKLELHPNPHHRPTQPTNQLKKESLISLACIYLP